MAAYGTVPLSLLLLSVISPGGMSIQLEKVDDDLLPLLSYINTRFLGECSLILLYDSEDYLAPPVNTSTHTNRRRTPPSEVEAVVRRLAVPMTIVALERTTNAKGQEVGQLPSELELKGHRTCLAYIIMVYDSTSLTHLVASQEFQRSLHYLGRYIFITGTMKQATHVALLNDVMSWRPHAVVVRKIPKEGASIASSSRLADYEMWTHNLFRTDVKEQVMLLERWRLGSPQTRADLFPDKLSNFHNNKLIAVTFEHPPAIVDVKDEKGHHALDGIDIRLLHILSEVLNFELEIREPSDGDKWGSPMENGSWSGLTGDVTERKAHMGVANLFIHIHYLKVVDMTIPYDLEQGCFITPLPGALPQYMALVYPFPPKVWIAALVLLAFGTPLLFLAAWSSKKLLNDESPWAASAYNSIYYGTSIFFGVGMPQFMRLALFSCGALGNHGGRQEPRSDTARGYFIMWVWYGLLITFVYRSALIAFLAIPLKTPPIDTLEQLRASSIPALGSTGLTFKKLMETNPDPLVQQLATRYIPVSGPEEGMALTENGKYAMMENRQFLEYEIAVKYTNQFGEETLHVMKECFLPFRIGLAMPKQAPYKPNFDSVIARVVEAGLVRQWFREILAMSRKLGSGGTEERGSGAFTLDNLQAAWLILGMGFASACVSFALELLLRRDNIGGKMSKGH